ncbi:hypothetical protein [Anabaena sp. PCC 7108]|nr:hypothetical protein [Anabaena sp. PCC 7108]
MGKLSESGCPGFKDLQDEDGISSIITHWLLSDSLRGVAIVEVPTSIR